MNLFGVLSGVLSVALVVSQLNDTQHLALMEVYNATGSFRRKKNLAFSTILGQGCNNATCPRFALDKPCTGAFLTCNGASVTIL